MILSSIISKTFPNWSETGMIITTIHIMLYFFYLVVPESSIYLKRVYQNKSASIAEAKIALFNSKNESKILNNSREYYRPVQPLQPKYLETVKGKSKSGVRRWTSLTCSRVFSSLPSLTYNLSVILFMSPIVFFWNFGMNFGLTETGWTVYQRLMIFGILEILVSIIFTLTVLRFSNNDLLIKYGLKFLIMIFLLIGVASTWSLIYIQGTLRNLPLFISKISVSSLTILLNYLMEYLFLHRERNAVNVLRCLINVSGLVILNDFGDMKSSIFDSLECNWIWFLATGLCVVLMMCFLTIKTREMLQESDNISDKTISCESLSIERSIEKQKFVRTFSLM